MITIDTSKTLGEQVRQARKAQSITQFELAGIAGVGVRFVRELEQGKATCQLAKVLHVLSILGLTLTLKSRGGW